MISIVRNETVFNTISDKSPNPNTVLRKDQFNKVFVILIAHKEPSHP